MIITYYWPPAGGGGVQRNLKYVKYLRDYGIEPIVLTAKDADYPVMDKGLKDQIPKGIKVYHAPIWEPYGLFRKFTGKGKNEKIAPGMIDSKKGSTWAKSVSMFIRGNFFIPDARMFWIRKASKMAKEIVEQEQIDVILSSGPPHTAHMIALNVKKALSVKWIADFRDPWTNIDFYDDLKLTKIADWVHKKKEKRVIDNCDRLLTVSWSWAEDFKRLGSKNVKVLTNGFDPEDFNQENVQLDKHFTISHVGSLNKDRNSFELWTAISELTKENEDFKKSVKLQLIGNIDIIAKDQLGKLGLLENVDVIDHMPHKDVLKKIMSSRVLLLLVNKTANVSGIIPGKLYEYLASKRPIVSIGDLTGDSAKVISESQCGHCIDYSDIEKMKTVLMQLFNDYKENKVVSISTNIDRFSRKNITKGLAQHINEITE